MTEKMKVIINQSSRVFHTEEGTIPKKKPVEVSEKLAAKLLKLYPDEITDLETVSKPYKADAAEKLTPPPAPKAVPAPKAEKAPPANKPGKKEEPKVSRLDELLAKEELTEDEADELKALEKAGS